MPDNTPSDPTDQTVEDYTYAGIIPKLGPGKEGDMHPSLLPIFGGQPGLEYLQCPVVNQKRWQQTGWKAVRNCSIYTIKGPLGSVDCVLLVTGVRLLSSDHQSNKRKLFLDPEIERITGLNHFTGTEELPDAETIKETPDGETPQQSPAQSTVQTETQSWREA